MSTVQAGDHSQVARAADLLLRARELVGAGWTQGADARAVDGTEVDPWADDAAAWSLLGALVAALEEHADDDGEELPLEQLAYALHELAAFVDEDSLAEWNDDAGRSQEAVVSTLTAAAEAAARNVPNPRA